MRLFAVARSAAMIFRATSGLILSYDAAIFATSTAGVAAAICDRRAVSSFGPILRNIDLVVTILTLVDEVLLFWIISCPEEFLLGSFNLVD